jgi:phosphoenolpyruvate carboxylase
MYARDVAALGEELSMSDASPALRACTAGASEPYRALLRKVQRGLESTRRAIEEQLSSRPGGRGGAPGEEVYRTAADLTRPLQFCFDSLHETGNGLIADGPLADVLRRLACFGLTLVRLDIRQDAQRHTEAVDLIARHGGQPGYADWTKRRGSRFSRRPPEIVRPVPPGPRACPTTPHREVLQTFQALAAILPESLGRT